MHDYDYSHTVDHGPHVLGWLIFAVLLALLVFAVVLAFSRVGRGWASAASSPPAAVRPPTEDPLEILRLRYARGEVDRDAFLQSSADLGGPSPPAA